MFVLLTPQEGYLWYGKGCSGDERELAKELANRLAPRFADDFDKVLENKEPETFWHLLGGRGPYNSSHYFEVKRIDLILPCPKIELVTESFYDS